MMKNTQIICTIGPSSWDADTMEKLAREGMDIARLNFSHGTHKEKAEQIRNIQAISKKLNIDLKIIADLQGPKLRLGKIEGERLVKEGEVIKLSINPAVGEIPLQFDLSSYVKKDQQILLNDGLVEVVILDVQDKTIIAKVQNNGFISSNKGINVPSSNLSIPALTEKDLIDLGFVLKQEVDFVALSFVQSAKDVEQAHDLIKKYQSQAQIIAKLEKSQAMENLEEIIKASDAIMIARGDLGIETELPGVPLLQKKIIRMCRQHSKFVIVATHMLESMTENPRPTRAEVSDVANAVFDQADAVMLSAETATGKYPVESVRMMASIIQSVESDEEFLNTHTRFGNK